MKILPIGALLGLAIAGCDRGHAPAPAGSAAPAAAPSGSAGTAVDTGGVPVGIPGDPAKVIEVVNPKHEKPYAGPTGTVRGRVRIEGDPPPDTGLKFPPNCKDAAATYGKLFRVGLENALADAMVAVTGYSGYVPAPGPAAKATIHGCAVNRRTVVMTFGQRLEVANLDKLDSYIPFLDGAPTRAGMVAVPGGEAVKLYPAEAGHYMIRDTMPSGLVADVFALKYATHDVTDLDGRYEIKGVPVGKVHVDVFLPVLNKSQGQALDVKEGDNTVDFTLKFDAAKDLPKPAASASAKPAAPPADDRKVPR
jgi:hypothetical protein